MAKRTTSTCIEDSDQEFLKSNGISVADAIRAHIAQLKFYQSELLFKENERLRVKIQGMQNEIARLTSQVSNFVIDAKEEGEK